MPTTKKINKVPVIIITVFLVMCCIALASFLSHSIYTKYDKGQRIANQSSAVKKKLKMIRKAQELYYQENDFYALDWDHLNEFVQHGELYNIERKEEVSLLENGLESVKVWYDTLSGPFSVADSLFPAHKYPNFDINSLNLVPNLNKPFILRTDTLEGISVFEVVEPTNPLLTEGKREALKIGSLTKVTTAGNWEK